MKQMLKGFLSIALLVSAGTAMADSDVTGQPFFRQRSQGDDLARRMVGEVHYLTRCDTDCFSGAVSAVAEYTRTTNKKDLAKFLTFNGEESMTFSSPNAGVATGDIDPVNFGLAAGDAGAVTFNPRVENFVFDLNARFNLDEWLCGLYFEIGLPINWTRWNIGLEGDEAVINAWKGDTTNTLLAMTAAKVDGRQTKTSVADLEFILGYNLWCTDCGHFGVNMRVAAPTGTRPDGEYFFEPVVGNGKSTALGGGVTAHYVLWENDCDQSFSVWFEGEVHHLFKTKQKRTFDLIGNGAGSRYLLLKTFENGVSQDALVRGPNVLNREVDASVGAVGEAVLLFNYQHCGFTVDFGYNIWGRGEEKLKLRGDDIADRTWAVQGGTTSASNETASKTKINGTDGGADAIATFITNASLNVEGAEHPSALSHKVFGHLSYAWEDCDYAPFVGVGGFGEWSGKGNRAFSQWGVWAKGGFAFS